ncbi:MAG TPA: uroporphyrinogen-III C-methyltransferase [Vicinamibacterales bacterium]|nr:uroporphyrinogen-III C-methyltransferase [Vicinamibacterales bacterium]
MTPVYLIGAGPGDPGLITARGLERLREADVVIHDHLVSSALLKEARRSAELIDVGIAAPQPMAQEAISILIAEKAREGKIVARLKWGDPFVFDRGGEEALFLHEQRIPFEVVPGVLAGTAVPAYAGVPVTYPGGGDTLTLVRGFEGESRTAPDIDWASVARLDGTVVCYAGAHQLLGITEALLANGWEADEPTIAVYNGTLPSQETVATTIGGLRERLQTQPPRREAAILVVGRVVGFREHLRWFDARPLFGRRVLITRPREQARDLVERLQALGADTVEAPMIRITPPDDPTALLQSAEDPSAFDWIVFTSANSVEGFMTALLSHHRDVRALKGPKLCTVGPGTAERLRRYSVVADVLPHEYRAEAVLGALEAHGPLTGARVLLPRSDIGREVIADQLRKAGAVVTDVIAYRTLLDEVQREGDPDVYGMMLEGRIHIVTFTSASAVRNFVRVYGADQVTDLLKNTTVAVIGPVTADAAREAGITVSVQPDSYTIGGLVDAIAAYFIPDKSLATKATED